MWQRVYRGRVVKVWTVDSTPQDRLSGAPYYCYFFRLEFATGFFFLKN